MFFLLNINNPPERVRRTNTIRIEGVHELAYFTCSGKTSGRGEGRRLRHSLVAEKRRRATISSLQDSLGNTISDPVILHDMAIQYYIDLFSPKGCSADITDFWQYIPSLVSEADNEMLTATPDLEEIKKAVFSLSADSAPGLDGFSGSFFTHCWDIIHSDIYEAVVEFFRGGHLLIF